MTNQDDRIRLFVGNAGPNLISSFHAIGTVFDRVYSEGDLACHPARYVQTTLIPAGSAVIEMDMTVAGNCTIVDHSINRIDNGADKGARFYQSQRKAAPRYLRFFGPARLPPWLQGAQLAT